MGTTNDSTATPLHEDLRLVSRFNAGDPAAFSELFQRHQSDVTRLVVRMIGSSGDVQDVIQEVFFQVFRSLPDFRGKSRLSTWIYRVAVNVVLMHRRARQSRPQLASEDLAQLPVDPGLPPDEQVDRTMLVARLENLMDRLSEKKRTVFVLHELQGLSALEIARIVGAPVLTVRTRLFYARRELISLIGRDTALSYLSADLSESDPRIAGASASTRKNQAVNRGAP